MKKLLTIILLVSFSVIAFTSCTDEEVKPQAEVKAPGGDPLKD